MANQAWLESSLRRSASLGLEVLERASRRSVDWTSTATSQTPTTTDEESEIPVKVAAFLVYSNPRQQLGRIRILRCISFLLIFLKLSCSGHLLENTLRA